MVFARRSALRAVNATRAFRSAPVAARSSQLFGRRFYSSGKKDKGYEEHTTSDLPWYVVKLDSLLWRYILIVSRF